MSMQKAAGSGLVRHFSPAWYASVMGTGGLANVLYTLGMKRPFLRPLAIGLWWLNILLFLLLIGPWIVRWFRHFDSLLVDLKHPVMSNFFVTMPVGALVLGTNFFMMGKAYFSASFISGLGLALWVFDVALTLFFGVFVVYNLMAAEKIEPELTNFSWFITPVASIIIPLLGGPLAQAYAPRHLSLAKTIGLVDLIFFGTGLILFFVFCSILIDRFIKHPMPQAMVTPTFWIILGPVGIGTISLLGLADSAGLFGLPAAADALKMAAVIFWGFGFWAFLLTVVISIKYLKNGGIPFSLSWWAFIFPLAAYVLSCLKVYNLTGAGAVMWYAGLLTLILAVLWVATFLRSLIGAVSGRLFLPPAADKK